MIIDVHTHNKTQKNAIINIDIDKFNPIENLFYSIGIHPWNIEKTDREKQFEKIYQTAKTQPQIIAIGECGLDSKIKTPIKIQEEIFEKHIELSEQLHKPLIIHCVRCSNEILRLYRKHKPQQTWIMHGFRSNSNVLRPILTESDIFISIGEKFNREALNSIPEERLLIETDESTLSIKEICALVASERNQTTEKLQKSITQNIRNILGF